MVIYKITNQINGKSYIGKSESSFKSRYGKNWIRAVSNDYLKKSIEKYGQHNFKVETLATTTDAEILCGLEKHFIKEHNTVYPNGFNFTEGGEGAAHIPATKKRISETMKTIDLHHRGKFTHGVKVDCKVCGKNFYTYLSRGRPNNTTCSKECSRKGYGVPLEAVNIITGEKLYFDSSNAAEKFGFQSSKISLCIHGKRSKHKGYSWRRL